MEKSDKNLLLYIAEELIEMLQSDAANDQDEVIALGKIVETMGRYLQSKGAGPGYMKMTKSEFILVCERLQDHELYADKADEIESEGGFIPE